MRWRSGAAAPAAALSSEIAKETHLISRLGDWRAWSTLIGTVGGGVTVVLLHDAVLETAESVRRHMGLGGAAEFPPRVLALRKDLERRSVVGRWPTIDYGQLIELLAEADRVVSW